MLALGGSLVLAGRLGMGAMLSVNVYNTFLAVGLAQLAGSLGDIGNAVASLQRCALGHRMRLGFLWVALQPCTSHDIQDSARRAKWPLRQH